MLFWKKEPIVDQSKQFKNFSITLPATHPLLRFQRNYPRYDKFLPYLANHIRSGETILDIGANVGDTLAAMVDVNPSAYYVCIEADDTFFNYLLKNTERMRTSFPALSVETIQAFVGQSITNVSLLEGHGTKRAAPNLTGTIQANSLDQLIAERAFPVISLLKTDTDGFDYDVLDSGIKSIERDKPILYLECQLDHEFQKQGYRKTFDQLEKTGYCDWTLFDNFGDCVIRTSSLPTVFELIEYVWRKTGDHAAKTIYYYDILGVTKNKSSLIDRILFQYLKFEVLPSSLSCGPQS